MGWLLDGSSQASKAQTANDYRWSTGQAMIDEAQMDRRWRGGAPVEGSPPQMEQRRRKLASPEMEQHRRWKEANEWRWI
ncbi:unnamed protein product [Lactuca virosa]|uniref:Uncharacterized protein n=1 Tax=Lactuca virosa TaxID=75947 RepID=A0AAU9PVH6_9ASTR|nr:unnamed protein product [Lactuca virosa]